MEKVIGSVVIMLIAAIVGFFLGAVMDDAMGGAILFVLISGIGCIISTIKNSNRDE